MLCILIVADLRRLKKRTCVACAFLKVLGDGLFLCLFAVVVYLINYLLIVSTPNGVEVSGFFSCVLKSLNELQHLCAWLSTNPSTQ